jgi:hypothetical protein
MSATCASCVHLDLAAAEKIHAGYARMGLGKCAAIAMPMATFITATHARECERFVAAPADVVAKRAAYLDAEQQRERK